MKKVFCIILIVFSSSVFYSQNDSLGVRHYFGVNISPVVGKMLGNDNPKASRWGVTYRRCIGLYNLRLAVVGINDSRVESYLGDITIKLNDSLQFQRRENTTNYSREFRLGLERKWASNQSKLYVGVGIAMGKYYDKAYYSQYYYEIISDSTGVYVADDFLNYDVGRQNLQYFKIGLDVCAGIAWDIGKHFNFMIQINPDLSYYSLIKNETEDPSGVFYAPKKDFTFLTLNSVDLMLGVRF